MREARVRIRREVWETQTLTRDGAGKCN